MNPGQIAATIRDQIGPQAMFMLGATNLMHGTSLDGTYLQFQVRGSKVANRVKVTLCADDLYEVRFYKCRGPQALLVQTARGIQADQLKNLLGQVLRLDVTL